MTEISKYEHGRFCWVDFSAHDKAAAETWYADLFGWEIEQVDSAGGPPYAMFRKNGKVVAGMGQLSDQLKSFGVPPMWNNYVSVDDAAAIAKRVVELGGKVTVEPMAVGDAGKLAFFTDDRGASFAVWQPGKHIGAELVNEPGTLSWNELASRDIAESARFYGELFGWQFVDVPGGHPYKVGRLAGDKDNCGFIQMDDNWGDMPECWCTYFAVEDCDATVEKVKSTGGDVVLGPQDIPQGRFAVVKDPQGGVFNVIALKGM